MMGPNCPNVWNSRSRYTGKIMYVMGFQHDLVLVNYVLVFVNLTQNVRARNWEKFRNMTVSDGVLMYETNSNILVKYKDYLKDQ